MRQPAPVSPTHINNPSHSPSFLAPALPPPRLPPAVQLNLHRVWRVAPSIVYSLAMRGTETMVYS